MSALNVLLFFVAVIFLCFFYVKRQYRYWEVRGVPFMKPKFPKGNFESVDKSEHLYEVFKRLYFTMKKDGTSFGGMYFTIKPAAIALDLDFVKTMLVKDFQYFHDRGIHVNERDDAISVHMITMEGEQWKNLRSKLTPTFTSGKMKMMFPIMMDISDKLISRLNEDVSMNNELDLGDYLSRFTIDIIGSCAFGLECNSIDNPDAEFLRMSKLIFNNEGQPLNRYLVRTFKGLSKILRFRLIRKEIADFYTKIVKETVEYRENENIQRDDYLNLLIQLKNKGKLDDDPGKEIGNITLNQVISNSALFLMAGYETSSSTMKFCMLELANSIDIQDRLREEIRSVLERYENKISYDAVSEMKYLEQVIKETLRKHAVVGLVRCLKNDYKVPNSDVILEKGIRVVVPVLAIHHDPEHYPDPEKFDPERFTPEAIKSRHPYAFLAFGDGPRGCIGMRFGMMQMKTGIICLLMNYKFFPCSKTKYPIEYVKSSSFLSPVGGCWLKMEKL